MNKKLRALPVSHRQDPTVQMDRLNGLNHLAGPLFERTSNPQSRKCWISEHPTICFIPCNGSLIGSFRRFIAAPVNKEANSFRSEDKEDEPREPSRSGR
ncbi:hypothetical protein [Aeromonas sanarellii]|uniref:Uncharacterized protein n=1 Tax=Aeromonas sanarellii TaxID=633415 RepID=A0ABS4B2A5_9GAMM|nr:hypothetical protein [Aeromonas sanarellii]MBP0600995.1 hypothetical protein [Aeromonas sanarellii]